MRNGGGRIITYYGRGEGKTSAAIGHAIRALGHGRHVIIFHFLKGLRNVGEYVFFKKNFKNAEVYLCGEPDFYIPGENDPKPFITKANHCIEKIRDIVLNSKCDMLILDELLYAIYFKIVSEDEILSIIKRKGDMHIIITGGRITPRIRKISDIVTEMSEIHHHYYEDGKTIEGLDY